VKEVRLIGEQGEQLGVVGIARALEIARQGDLDLVEVAPTAVPPVCRVMDYGRFRYEQNRKDRDAKKSQRPQVLREVRMRPRIDDHDIDFKTRIARKFLEQGDKVKITIMYRGREMAHPELGANLLRRVVEILQDVSKIERTPEMEGRRLSIIVSPGLAKKPASPVEESVSA